MINQLHFDNIYNLDLTNILKECDISDVNNNIDGIMDKIIILKKYTYNNITYNILKYNKSKFNKLDNNQKNDYLNIRSLIFKDGKLVVFSPPKSIDYSLFVENYNKEDCYCEDFIDGTMINVFYDDTNKCWEIATRSTVGGKNYFYDDYHNIYNAMYNSDNNQKRKIKTFRDMFFQACEYNNFNINSLVIGYTYTFVIQHPYNRIVTPIIVPVLYLVKIYKINCIDNYDNKYLKYSIENVNMQSFYENKRSILENTSLKYVYRYPIDSFKNVYDTFSNGSCEYYCVGIMLYNNNGCRSKVRNPNYNNVKLLRGNNPKLQYNFFCLKKENRIGEFLNYYPEHKDVFNKFRNEMYNYTNNLFNNYIKCYIKKESELKKFNFEYKVHMYNIHRLYLEKLKSNKKYVDKKFVIDYVNNLHPAQQMFLINYSNYEHKKIIKSTDCNNLSEETFNMEVN